MIEYRGAILGSDILPLAIEGRRVVRREKDFEYLAIGCHGRIKGNLKHFGMTRRASAYLFVARVSHSAAGITRDHRAHALQLLEHRLHAPEAAPAQRGDF